MKYEVTKVTTEKELGTALKKGEDTIEIRGDLKKKVITIKATGGVAWGVAAASLAVAIVALYAMPTPAAPAAGLAEALGLGGTVAAFAVTGAAEGVSGAAVAVSAAMIGAAGGGIAALNQLRNYTMEKRGDVLILKKK